MGKQKKAKVTENLQSAFKEIGLNSVIEQVLEEAQKLYLEDEMPWVIGYSGGKDSTAVLQLVWKAIVALPLEKRRKPIHVISTDTLVENPIVAQWVTKSLDKMAKAAKDQELPIYPHRLTPETRYSFWVNLIGRGYPAPRNKFRWCTERLKIRPSNKFINDVVNESGEAILILGTRKAESRARAGVMNKLETKRIRDRLSPNSSLPNSLVYTPIENWSNDDVWIFLMQSPNPWGYSNKDLLTMYSGASADGECPLVVDTSTPSCGDSRFGCWVCTLVEEDRSMAAMINNDLEKEWMLPLLQLRNELDVANDRHLRDFRRLAGNVQIFNGQPIPGPYTQEARERWLRKVLEAQNWIREHGPQEVRHIDLITLDELQEINRIWVIEKHEIENRLPIIYREVMQEEFPGHAFDESSAFGLEEMDILLNVCGNDRLQYELIRDLIDVEHQQRTSLRRLGLFEALEATILKSGFKDKDEAIREAHEKHEVMEAAKKRDISGVQLAIPINDAAKDMKQVESGCDDDS